MSSQSSLVIDVGHFQKELESCIRFSGDRMSNKPTLDDDIADVYRSTQLQPFAARVYPDSCHTAFSNQLIEAFSMLRYERSLLALSDTFNLGLELDRQGAFLLFDWQGSLFDGAATPETCGFLDDDYMPPWDVWLELVAVPESVSGHCLLSWIPPQLSDLVDRGVVVDPAETLTWCSIERDGHLSLLGWGDSFEA